MRGSDHMTSFDVGQIDDVIHGRFRLGIMAYLAREKRSCGIQ